MVLEGFVTGPSDGKSIYIEGLPVYLDRSVSVPDDLIPGMYVRMSVVPRVGRRGMLLVCISLTEVYNDSPTTGY